MTAGTGSPCAPGQTARQKTGGYMELYNQVQIQSMKLRVHTQPTQSLCIPLQRRVPVKRRPVYITTAESTTYLVLLQLREFIPTGGNCKIYLPDKRDQEHMNCQRQLNVLLQILCVLTFKCKPCCRIQLVNVHFQIQLLSCLYGPVTI